MLLDDQCIRINGHLTFDHIQTRFSRLFFVFYTQFKFSNLSAKQVPEVAKLGGESWENDSDCSCGKEQAECPQKPEAVGATILWNHMG